MSHRQPIGNVLRAVLPFVLGLLIGGTVTAWVLCINLGMIVCIVADTPSNRFDAFLVWMIFAMPIILVAATIWVSVAMFLLWILSPYPLAARHPYLIIALGFALSANFAITSGLAEAWGCLDGNLWPAFVVWAPLGIAPLLMITRDHSDWE